MTLPRRFRPLCLALALAPIALLSGCGSRAEQSVVEVDPEFKKQNNAMLDQMSKDMVTKFKKPGARMPKK